MVTAAAAGTNKVEGSAKARNIKPGTRWTQISDSDRLQLRAYACVISARCRKKAVAYRWHATHGQWASCLDSREQPRQVQLTAAHHAMESRSGSKSRGWRRVMRTDKSVTALQV